MSTMSDAYLVNSESVQYFDGGLVDIVAMSRTLGSSNMLQCTPWLGDPWVTNQLVVSTEYMY
jgi:hypothetical protein